MSLLEVITKASIENSPNTADGNYPIVLNSDPVLLQLKPENPEIDDVSLVKRSIGLEFSSTDREVIELGQNFVKKLKRRMKNLKTFNKVEFFEMLASYLSEIQEKFGVNVDRVDEGNIIKLIEKLGNFLGRDVRSLILEACFVLENWGVLESFIVNGLVEHSCLSNLINNLIKKEQTWLVVLCVKHVLDFQSYDMMRVLKYFLSLAKNNGGNSSLISVRKEWESQALSAIEKAKDSSLGTVRMDMAKDASLLLMLAHDGFLVSEMCLHYLLASRNVDEVILGACISKLNGEEITVLIRYLKRWLNKYERFPQVCPCPKAPFELGLKACEWVPSLEDIVKCLALVVDEHFSSLVLHQEFREELKSLDGVVDSLTAEAKICGFMSNLTEALKSKVKG